MNPKILEYELRFLTQKQSRELLEYWRMFGPGHSKYSTSRHERMLVTCREFCKNNPNVSEGAAYKDLDGLLQGW